MIENDGTTLRVLYLSYDGIAEPLGRSQVLAYLRRLASEFEITLVSFEKPGTDLEALREQLRGHEITPVPLRYHRRPPVLSTLLDVARGVQAVARAVRDARPMIVHVRSYVPALIAVLAKRRTGGRLLFDIRGFWADERVDGGLWRAGGLLYRIAKRCERRFFREADAVVTLTEASVPQIRSWTGERQIRVEVIPTCVDCELFRDRPARPDGPHAVWCGSIGTWYRFDLAPRIAEALSLPLTVISRQVELARQLLGPHAAVVESVPPEAVPSKLFAGDVGLCLISPSFSKIASAPTRFAEYLAVGMPVFVTRGVGDLESTVEKHGVGVVLRGEEGQQITAAAEQMAMLLSDAETPERCRRLAAERFDVNWGAARYAAIYREL
jgi:glycosyltransferase involved in cell wall biosynthesis